MCLLHSKPWRGRLIYTVMSVFVGWHTIAILAGPVPDVDSGRWPRLNVVFDAIRTPFKPYLTSFRLDGSWGFFAPNVRNSSWFRYVVEDAIGKRHVYEPTMPLRRFDPLFFRIEHQYLELMDYPEEVGDSAAAMLCRKHASLQPVAISYVEVKQKDFRPDDYRSGKGPLDAAFVTVNPLKRVECPGS